MKTWNEARAVTIYREFLSHELKQPGVLDAKKNLIRRYFLPEPVLPPIFSIPALGLAFMLLCFFRFQPEGKFLQQPSAAVVSSAPAGVGSVGKVPVSRKHRTVLVHRVSSRAGAAMVYQKHYKEAPITIIWVFPAAGGAAF